jgi:hypothetical protein
MICEIAQFWVADGALRKGLLDSCAKGQETFTQTATGKPEGDAG